jgi:hypothetical protein
VPSSKDKASISKKSATKNAAGKTAPGKAPNKKQAQKVSTAKPPKNPKSSPKVVAKPAEKPTKKAVAAKALTTPKAKPTPAKPTSAPSPKNPPKSHLKTTTKTLAKTAVKAAEKTGAVAIKPLKASMKPASGAATKKSQKTTATPMVAAKAKPLTSPQATPAATPVRARTITRIHPDDIVIPKKQPLPIPPKTNTDPKIVEKIRSAHVEKELRKDLAQEPPKRQLTQNTPVPPVAKGEDRIVLLVRDPYWLHAHWDLTRATVDRAKAALIDHWHSVKPVLRLLKFEEMGTTDSAETVYRQIEIHGGVRNWYIDVDKPPSQFQIIMGYMTGNGRFYELVRSNVVTTPIPGSKDSFDDHWADIANDAERIYAMSGGYGDETTKGELAEIFQDRLKRTMELDVLSQFGSGAEGGLRKPRQFHFEVEAEILVFGSTHPDAHVSIGTEPVKVQGDGTFSARLPLPDRRQVLPATARSRDGVDERTVVIAVERNTKVMEPLSIDAEDL